MWASGKNVPQHPAGENFKSNKEQDEQQHAPSCPNAIFILEHPANAALRRLRDYERGSARLQYVVQVAS
jgi:hypothetical protein